MTPSRYLLIAGARHTIAQHPQHPPSFVLPIVQTAVEHAEQQRGYVGRVEFRALEQETPHTRVDEIQRVEKAK